MIVDTSALMAVLLFEPDRLEYFDAMRLTVDLRLSAGNFVELATVSTRGHAGRLNGAIDHLLGLLKVRIEPFTAEQAAIARQAYRTFGKGTGHPARLNFGDCFAYALAMETGKPLLFKGDDFIHTYVHRAAYG